MHQYEVSGRMKPTKTDSNPKVYRMKIFAANTVVARSRFWYYMSLLKRVKKANGEICAVHEIFEKNANHIQNFGVQIRYDSRSGTHNMYKEFRALTLNDAIDMMYAELASRHRVRKSSVQIIRTTTLAPSECKRPRTTQFHNSKLEFPLVHRVPRASDKAHRSTFKAKCPSSFF